MTKHYAAVEFTKTAKGFKHHLKADFACFALWKNARPYQKRIRELLASQFELLLETEIVWSEARFHENANRLYEAPIFNDSNRNTRSLHADKIGDHRFILFVVSDPHPYYTYAQSVSKKIELSNLNIVKAKYKMRDWIQKDTGVKYGVHSTNSIYEFLVQAPLLLGIENLEKLLNGEQLHIPKIEKDLEGAGGWKNYKALFQILNSSGNYLVQRSFESLPNRNEEKDLDLLTDDYQRLASLIGMKQSSKRPYKGRVKIGKEEISIDIRFVGDKYYDASWQKDMLRHKVFKNGIYIPREDDYFFSLLFHCKVQKDKVKEKYFEILQKLSEHLDFDWYNNHLLIDDKATGEILNGYFRSQGYAYEKPIDKGVYENRSITRYLQKTNVVSSREIFIQHTKTTIKRILPNRVIEILKQFIKR